MAKKEAKKTKTPIVPPASASSTTWVYNDSHKDHRVLHKDPVTRFRTDCTIPQDNVAELAASVARAEMWVDPPHPALGKPRRINSHLSECSAAEAAAHMKRRGLPVPEEGSNR